MLKKLFILVTLYTYLFGFNVLAHDDHNITKEDTNSTFQSNAWDIGISGNVIYEGSNGDWLKDTSFGFGLHVGYRFADHWSGVLEVSSYKNPNTLNDFKTNIVDYVGNLTYDFFPEKTSYTPYLSVGLGYRTISDVPTDRNWIKDRDNWNFLPGVGIKYLLSDSIQLALDIKGRFNLELSETGVITSIVISYRFDKRE